LLFDGKIIYIYLPHKILKLNILMDIFSVFKIYN